MWFYFTSAILLFAAATAKACSKASVKISLPFAPRRRSGQAPLMDVSNLPDNAGENI